MTNGGLQKVSGQITAIDHTKRTLVLKDKDSIITALKWSEGLDGKMQKNKQWFFVTALFIGDVMDDVHYFKKPDDWPQNQQQGNKAWMPKKPRVTIAATVNLQNYENIKVEVEGNSPEECTKILIDTLDGFATRPEYSTTRDMIQSYMARVLNVPKGGV